MMESFAIFDAQDALEYLNTFDARTRSRGDAYFRNGRVRELLCTAPGQEYQAVVQGTQLYQVSLFLDEQDGWCGLCSCPMEIDCKHAYAVMKAVLAESSVASVRGLSAGRVPAPGRPKAKPSSPRESQLARQLAAALGRRLAPEESAFLRKLTQVHQRCQMAGRITTWDFHDLGLYIPGNTWEERRIWPALPGDEHDFWLYVAHAAREQGVDLPAFLAPVTDLAPIEKQLAQWRRRQEVDRWKQVFSNLDNRRLLDAAGGLGTFDLRLMITTEAAILQCQRPGRDAFEELKLTQFQRMSWDHNNGRLEFSLEAELLWEVFAGRFDYGRGAKLRYAECDGLDILNRALRLRMLHSRTVNAAGQPLVRADQPLQWNLGPPADGEEDYHLRLVQADGTPLPALLFALEGAPTLYVTADTIFPGPSACENALNLRKDNRIPMSALESPAGVEFLQALKVDLPPRLRERVCQVPVEVTFQCEIQPAYRGSSTEYCTVSAVAESADGKVTELWDGNSWVRPRGGKAKSASPSRNGQITLYDRSALRQVPFLLDPLGLKYDGYSGKRSLRVTRKFPEVFVPWLKSLPPHIKVALTGELASLAEDAVSGRVRLDVTETAIDWFDLQVVLDVQDTNLTPAEIKLLLNAKGKFVRLKDKGWRRLQFDLDNEEDERLARLGLNPHELTAEPQRLHALQLADEAARKFLPEQQFAQVQRRASEIKARVTPDLPGKVTATLRPYQQDGFHFLAYLATNRFGGILADDMGLGKTLQTLAWLVWAQQSANDAPGETATAGATPHTRPPDTPSAPPQPKPVLVVCPKSVMDNWQAEAERFVPGLRVKTWLPSELKTFLDRLPEADVHVLNYSQLRKLGENLVPITWLAVVLDEGQYIKNPNSQTAQVARALRAEHRLVLTGTPIENRLLDLWSLMTFAMPGVLGSRNHFARLYDAKADPFARRRLAARVRPFLLRRTKTQVAKELPDRIEEDLFCEIEGVQKTLYRAELKRAQQLLLKVKTQKQLAREQFHFLTSLLRLRQICCHPALVQPESKAESAKLNALLEQLEPLLEEGHKVLVFSQFVQMLGLLKQAMVKRKWRYFYLAGETENRGELVRNFQSTEGAAVFLISLKAGGFGLNLTAASYVVLFDPWWNPAVEHQAIDRTHRIGQTNKVIAYRLLIKNSVEEKIRALQKQKKALAEDVLGEEKFAQNLSLDDLKYLFAD